MGSSGTIRRADPRPPFERAQAESLVAGMAALHPGVPADGCSSRSPIHTEAVRATIDYALERLLAWRSVHGRTRPEGTCIADSRLLASEPRGRR
jgi:hypothetical protein